MNGLYGPHVNQIIGGLPEFVARWKPPVALVMDHSPVWGWVKTQSPDTILIGRWHQDAQPDFNSPLFDAVAYARQEMAELIGAIVNSPYDYIVGRVNEPVINSELGMRNLAKYDITRMEILYKHGKRAAIGQLSAGAPGNMQLWREYLPAFQAAIKYKAVLALHQYDWPEIGKNDHWLPYRHELVYGGCPEHGWEGVPENLRIPIILTEFGLDEGVVHNGVLNGWRGVVGPKGYMVQLQVANDRLMKSPYIIGACIFCTGNISSNWVMFDFWPEIQQMEFQPVYRKLKWPDGSIDDEDILGIDVSEHQPVKFPWGRAAGEGNIQFAILRTSIGIYEDTKFQIHYKNSLPVMPLGLYHFVTSQFTGREQAKKFRSLFQGRSFPLGLWADVETHKYPPTPEVLYAFREEMSMLLGGQWGHWYSSSHMWNIHIGHRNSRWAYNDKLWAADWRQVSRPAVPKPFRRNNVEIWQYRVAPAGTLRWYPGRLDLDRWVAARDLPQLW